MNKQYQITAVEKHKGFTLVELITTIVIAGVLTALAVPSFHSFSMNNRLTTQINELVTAISLTRNEAIKRGSSVTICKSNTQTSCAGNWTDGWVVFADPDGDGVIDAGEAVIRVHATLSGGNTLSFGAGNRITYSSQGIAVGFNNTFRLCDKRGAPEAKGVIVSNTGRARLAIDSDGDGTVEGGSTTNITCP